MADGLLPQLVTHNACVEATMPGSESPESLVHIQVGYQSAASIAAEATICTEYLSTCQHDLIRLVYDRSTRQKCGYRPRRYQ